MNIIHTSDWHLGQRFFDRDRFDEHEAFLGFLLKTIKARAVDLLIVAGDLFDTANPPREAERMYYHFLTELSALGTCSAVIVGGNHDSAPHLDAPATVLQALRVQVVGALPDDAEKALFHIPCLRDESDPGVWVAAVPYLRDRDVRKAVAGESFDDLEARTRAGVVAAYEKVADALKAKKPEAPVIATGHLTALGGSVSDSERTIHIGNLGSISGGQFPECFDYVALGHLHRAQKVAKDENIRYSGSPIPLSFSEATGEKEIRLIETGHGTLTQETLAVPAFRRLIRLKGEAQALKEKLTALEVAETDMTPWLELVVKGSLTSTTLNEELRALADAKGAEVLKVGLDAGKRKSVDLELSGLTISELKPEEVFKRRLDAYDGEVPTETLSQCFAHLLTQAQEVEK
ncbi:exonuclease SbcCD subunit D C-terminal domain-containing protein [Desulfoluna sp.]|uniref:exonuclease SbcCD subunit D C-terminal domain-containing protein n=1 Tax=Desulfoluna sp. TaxID=2045199 RepID=UPI0026265D82|nr:exonuclease SbcCD subunit D C-terminal domain-containing protein [Desulfoluna sp.]